jgi:segregation and condensation protein A
MPILHLEGFDGPMDLLLDLAERQRVALGRISLLALVEQFVGAFLMAAAHVPMELRADWLVLATRLVLLRSRLLFAATPEAATAAERDAEEELAHLRELRSLRAAVAWLEARPQLGRDVLARPRRPDPVATSYMALLEACLTVLRARDEALAGTAVYRPQHAGVFRIESALARLRSLVAGLAEARPLMAFLPRLTEAARREPDLVRSAVASTLIAALELARDGLLTLEQEVPFATITLAARTAVRGDQLDEAPA